MEIFKKLKENRLKSSYKRGYNSDRMYPEYKMLDILIIYLEEVGIKSYEKTSELYYSKIIFNDGTEYSFWNDDTQSAWMTSGKINFSNGEKLSWSYKCPTYEVLYKYKIALTQLEKKKEDEDYSKYLPIKILRKIKLDKLK